MKTILGFLSAVALAGVAKAGLVTFHNDLGATVYVSVVHGSDTLLVACLEPGQSAAVQIDERRAKRPLLMVPPLSASGNKHRTADFHALPKTRKSRHFEMSWFMLSDGSWNGAG
jgi:hypothetical protein